MLRTIMNLAFPALLTLFLSGLFWSSPGLVHAAEDPTHVAARTLGYAGIDAYDAGDFETAAQHLEQAYAVLRVPSLGLWSARALREQGRWVEAERRLREVIQLSSGVGEPEIQRQARIEALQDLTQLEPKVPRLVIALEGASPEAVVLSVDGSVISSTELGQALAVNPGERRLLAVRQGQEVELVVTVREGERKNVTLKFPQPSQPSAVTPARPAQQPALRQTPAPEHEQSKTTTLRQVLPWALGGTGAASLVVAGISLGMALGEADKIDTNPNCVQRACLASESRSVERFNTLNTVSGITAVGGGLLLAAGVTLWLVDQETHASQKPVAALQMNATSMWLTGAF